MAGYLFLTILALSLVAYFVGNASGRRLVMSEADPRTVHSQPAYHGMFVAIWVGIPALVLVLLWLLFQNSVVDSIIWNSLPEAISAGKDSARRNLILSEIHNVAEGRQFSDPTPETVAAADRLNSWQSIMRIAMFVVALSTMILGLFFARSKISVRFPARHSVERFLDGFMLCCSVVAFATTLGIIVSLVYEAWEFFSLVSPADFFFGTRWEPQIALREDQIAGEGAFGALPVFLGTLVISAIAMVFAVPTGIFTAIYLNEYASNGLRRFVKPMLEILAGVPTVVYGFFAVLTIAPAIRDAGSLMGITTSPNSALTAGMVIGIMIIPLVSSLADDALKAVPRGLRDGSLAMGATPGETMTQVLLPAALPGIMGGVLLALSRAIGETMIVVMAAGLIASMNVNPLESVTTVTVQIVMLLTGDTEFDSPKTLAAFALGLVLFVVTLALNVLALYVVRRFSEKYD